MMLECGQIPYEKNRLIFDNGRGLGPKPKVPGDEEHPSANLAHPCRKTVPLWRAATLLYSGTSLIIEESNWTWRILIRAAETKAHMDLSESLNTHCLINYIHIFRGSISERLSR